MKRRLLDCAYPGKKSQAPRLPGQIRAYHRAERDRRLPSPYFLPSLEMLAARTSATRATRAVRNFASVAEAAGVKVAAVDNGEPTTSVTFLVKAGSRYQNKPGVAHALQNFAFKVRLCLLSLVGRVSGFDRALANAPVSVRFVKLSCTAVSCPQA